MSYSRRPLGQTGDGHFSPVGGYHAASDAVLVLDVARFKHPPHWLPLPLLWEAMLRQDGATKRARGYATLARAAPPVGGGMGGGAIGGAIVSGRPTIYPLTPPRPLAPRPAVQLTPCCS